MTTDEVSKHKRLDVNFCAPHHGSTYQCRALHQESGAGSASVTSRVGHAFEGLLVYLYFYYASFRNGRVFLHPDPCACTHLRHPASSFLGVLTHARRNESSSALSRYSIVTRSGPFVANLGKFRSKLYVSLGADCNVF